MLRTVCCNLLVHLTVSLFFSKKEINLTRLVEPQNSMYKLGLWLSVIAPALPQQYSSCNDAQTMSPIDGDYTIRVASTAGSFSYEVYCYMMGPNVDNVTDPDAPYTYITLPAVQAGSNIAQWVYGNQLITTTFHKVQFDPTTLRIITGDCKYTSGTIVVV